LAPLTSNSKQADAEAFKMHCPYCNAETFLGDCFCQECGAIQPAFVEKPPNFFKKAKQALCAKPMLFAACIAAGLVLAFGIVGLKLFFDLPGELRNALNQNRLNDATELAQKLMVSRFGYLDGADAELHNAAFHRRAKIFANNRNFKMALADLMQVRTAYSQFTEVEQLKSLYSGLLFQPAPSTLKSGGANVSVATPSTDAVQNSDVPARRVASSAARQSEQALSRQAAEAAGSSELKHSSSAESEVTEEPSTSSSKEEVNSDTEEAEMAAYNRQLAEHFQSRESRGSAAKEPPSFTEWIGSGKAAF